MELIDIDNIDYVILEDSLHRIEHKKGDEIDCVIGAETVRAIPLAEVKQAREEIEQAHEDLDGYDPQAVWDYISHVDEILDKLIAESET